MYAVYAADPALHANTLSQAESPQHNLKLVARGIGLYIISDKT